MACDFTALANVDSEDPEQLLQLLDQCTRAATDPRLWLWALVLTVVCGAVGAWIGKRRNSVMRDAILGATLGPIGWIISWFLQVAKPKPLCQACKGEVGAGDAHCRHCGARLGSR